MVKRKKGKTIIGFRSGLKGKKAIKKKCDFGVNKYTGKCLRYPRPKN
jgi:hypothetical protein